MSRGDARRCRACFRNGDLRVLAHARSQDQGIYQQRGGGLRLDKPESTQEMLNGIQHHEGLSWLELNVRLRVHTHSDQGPKRDPNSGAREGAPCNKGPLAS